MPYIHELRAVINIHRIQGDENAVFSTVIALDPQNSNTEALMWCSAKNLAQLKDLQAGTVICPDGDLSSVNSSVNLVVVDNPRMSFMKLLRAFFLKKPAGTRSSSAIIHPSVKIGESVTIGEHVVIEENSVIGDRCVIGHNTVINASTIIGRQVSIGANCTIGGVGFGYEKDEEGLFQLIPHLGNVVIGDNVEIGNNTCIDRAVLGSTVIKASAKIDNLVHIAHGVQVGTNSMVIANAMVAGSVKIGDNSWIAPSASILNQKALGSDVTIGMAAVVVKDVPDGQTIAGSPGEEISEYLRMRKRLKELLKGE